MAKLEEFAASNWRKTTEANRERKIYMCAIEKLENIDFLIPPPTDEEKQKYKSLCERMRKEEAKAKAEGRKLIWDIPFDLDND